MKYILKLLISAGVFCLTFFAVSSYATEYKPSDYHLYLTGSGGDQYLYLKAKRKYIFIGVDILIPIEYGQVAPDYMLKVADLENIPNLLSCLGVCNDQAFELVPEGVRFYNLLRLDLEYIDLNGDGIDELYSPSLGLTLSGLANEDNPVNGYSPSKPYVLNQQQYIGSLALFTVDSNSGFPQVNGDISFSISDHNSDGIPDFMVKYGGFSSVAYADINDQGWRFNDGFILQPKALVGSIKANRTVDKNGSFNYHVRLNLPPGVNGLEPQLSLNYNSSTSKGLLGQGWHLNGVRKLVRCSSTMHHDGEVVGVKYDSASKYCFGGERLVRDNEYPGVFYPEGSPHTKVTLVGDYGNPSQFEVRYSNGLIDYFKPQVYSKDGYAMSWYLSETKDRFDNYINYDYKGFSDSGEKLISSIRYAENTIEFEYIKLNDAQFQYRYGVGINRNRILKRINILTNGQLVTFYSAEYDNKLAPYTSTISTSVLKELHYCDSLGRCIAPLKIEWGENSDVFYRRSRKLSTSFTESDGWNLEKDIFRVKDVNLDGYSDIVAFGNAGVYVQPQAKGEVEFVLDRFGSEQGWNIDNHIRLLADINGDGFPDIVGFGNEGVHTALATGDYGYVDNGLVLQDFGVDNGYSLENHPRIVTDTNGDGFADIIAFSDQGVRTALAKGDGTFNESQLVLSEFGAKQGWEGDDFPRIVGDTNGDGIPDILAFGEAGVHVALGTGYGTFEYQGVGVVGFGVSQGWRSSNKRYLVDINDDGNGDILGFSDSGLQVALSDGLGGFVDLGKVSSNFSSVSGWANSIKVEFSDVNKDGYTDIVGFAPDGYVYWGYSMGNGYFVDSSKRSSLRDIQDWRLVVDWYYRSDNRTSIYGWFLAPDTAEGCQKAADAFFMGLKPVDLDAIAPLVLVGWDSGDSDVDLQNKAQIKKMKCKVDTTFRSVGLNFLGDVNADGTPDIVKITPLSGVYSRRGVSRKIQAEVFDNGMGAKTSVSYGHPKPKTKEAPYPAVMIAGPRQVVESIEVDDLVGGTNRTTYSYENYMVHTHGLGGIGFEKISKFVERTNLKEIRTLSQDWESRTQGLLDQSTLAHVVDDVEVIIEQVDNELDVKLISLGDEQLIYPYIRKNEIKSYDLSGTYIGKKVVEKTYTDRFANLDTITESYYNADGSLERESITDFDYYSETNYLARWQPGLVQFKEVAVRSDKQLPYDVIDSFITKYEYTYKSEGVVASEAIVFSETPLKKVNVSYLYNDMGLRTSTTHSAVSDVEDEVFQSRTSTFEYDDLGRVKFKYNALSKLTDSFYYNDERFPRLVTDHKDINNLVTKTFYDSLGGVNKIQDPHGRETITSQGWCSPIICQEGEVFYKESVPNISAPSTVFYDALMRPVRNTTLALKDINGESELVTISTLYNGAGLKEKVSLPFYGADPQFWTSYTYDDLGRKSTVSLPNGSLTIYSYNSLSVSERNERDGKSQTTTTTTNILGQVVKVIDALQNEVEYLHSSRGNIVKTTSGASGSIVGKYSSHNTKLVSKDPDRGEWHFTYDLLGQLVKQKDAKGQVTKFEYDRLGRLVKRIDNAGKATESVASWVYDLGVMGLGKLTSVSQPGFSEEYTYHQETGLLSTTKTYSESTTFESGMSYDEYGRVDTYSYPKSLADSATGLVIKNSYHDELGIITKVNNASTQYEYWKFQGQWEFGNLKSVKYGNQVEVEYGLDHANGKLSIINAHYAGDVLKYMTYDYDYMGNLEKRSDLRDSGNFDEILTYDSLNRLSSYQIETPVFSQNDYVMGYSSNGNIETKPGVGTFSYGGTCNDIEAGPHAVTSISGPGNNSYCYDENGNMVKDDNRTIEYAPFDKPLSVVHNNGYSVSYKYAPGRELLRKAESGPGGASSTILLPGYERKQDAGGVEHRYYIGDYAVVVESGGSQEVNYLLRDSLGSVIAVLNQSAEVIDEYSFDPWGLRRTGVLTGLGEDYVSQVTDLAFGGHQQEDAVGLVHMGGRIYDPLIGRFLSPDIVVQSLFSSQNFNRYSYVLNNPLSLADPTGYEYYEIGVCFGQCDSPFWVTHVDNDGNFNTANLDFDFGEQPHFDLDFSHLAFGSGLSDVTFDRIDPIERYLGPNWHDKLIAGSCEYTCGVNFASPSGVGQSELIYLPEENYFDQIIDKLLSLRVTQFGRSGTAGVFSAVAGGEVGYAYGISIDWRELGNTKLYFQLSEAAGAGFGLGFYATRGAVAGLSDTQFETGFSGDITGSAFGFITPSLDFTGPATSASVDFNRNGGSFAGWNSVAGLRMYRTGLGVGLGGGGAIGYRVTFTYATPSINDLIDFFSE